MKQHFPYAGVNLVGYTQSEFGISNVAQYCFNALKSAQIPCCFIPVETLEKVSKKDFVFPLTIYFVNADTIKGVKQKIPSHCLEGQYEIAVWFWELEKIPDYFTQSMRAVDEVWCFSEFITQAFRPSASIPIVQMPFPYSPPEKKQIALTQSPFIFFFAFDYLSDFERKNPLAILKAFQKAFPEKEPVRLIVKSRKGDLFPMLKEKLCKAATEDERIELLDAEMSKEDLLKLMSCAQVFVSLHRAEGLGLHLMDALSMEKPVITTAYGGVNDFITKDYPGRVPYRKVPVSSDYEHYQISCEWADPLMNDAAARMSDCFRHYSDWVSHTKNNYRYLLDTFSPAAFTAAFKKRINEIALDPALKARSGKIQGFSEFSLLKERLKGDSGLKLLITQTVRSEKIERLLSSLHSEFPLFQLHLFGTSKDSLQDSRICFHCYPLEGRFLLSDCPSSLLEELREEKFDAAIIPYYNYCGKGYENIEEILNAVNIPLKIGVGIEGDLFVHE